MKKLTDPILGQNVACDPCKLRRVKCDLLSLLSQPGPSTSCAEDEPAHLLVRRNPDISCTQCRNKNLPCSTEGIMNPVKPNKGGKRIEEARKRFGKDEAVDGTPFNNGATLPDTSRSTSTTGFDPNFASTSFLDTYGPRPDPPAPPTHSVSAQSKYLQPSNNPREPADDMAMLEQYISQSLFPQGHLDPSAMSSPFAPTLSASHTTQPPQPQVEPPLWNPGPEGISLENQDSVQERNPIQVEAMNIWRRLSVNTPQTIASRSLRPVTPVSQPTTPPIHDMSSHTPHPITLIPALGKLDIATNQFMPILPVYGNSDDQRDNAPHNRSSDHAGGSSSGGSGTESRTNDMIRYSTGQSTSSASAQTTGKRHRTSDSSASTPGSMFSGRMMKWESDPWHIWQSQEERESSLVAWGRKEQVQENLADRAIGVELSRHLITVYFQAVHFSLPVRLPSHFLDTVQKDDQVTDKLCRCYPRNHSTWNGNPVVVVQTV